MKSPPLLTAGAMALLCLVGCQSTRVERAAKPPLDIRVVGPAGVSFTGTVNADGVVQEVSGTAAAGFQFACSRLSCHFRQDLEPGVIRFEVFEGERLVGSSATTGPRGHCRFSVREGAMGGRTTWRFALE